MFKVDSDKTINLTRGDVCYFSVYDEKGEYVFQVGDVVRFSVYEKKNCENVVLEKDFIVSTPSEEVEIYLEEDDTKLEEPISKPKVYWYEIVLNPETKPETIIGYDDAGAKILRLYPESNKTEEKKEIKEEDLPFIDDELDAFSNQPVRNKAITRAILTLDGRIDELKNLVNSLKNIIEAKDGGV